VVSSNGGAMFDLVCANGTFWRHKFSEGSAEGLALIRFTASPAVGQKLTRTGAGRLLAVAGEGRQAHVLKMERGATVVTSAAAIQDVSGISKVTAMASAGTNGPRIVALLTEGTGASQRNRVLHVATPADAAWIDFVTSTTTPIFQGAKARS